jgi:hypothetical protein
MVMIFFNGWNWYLCLEGYTAIEFWGQRKTVVVWFVILRVNGSTTMDSQGSEIIYWKHSDLPGKCWLFNFSLTLFLPSIRELPFNGLEWTFENMRLGFNIDDNEDLSEDEEDIAIG